ncbi:MAG TPA: glycosyltransferase family 4 protein [Opitutaceae bacterium]|jgi:colanic acid biosynthesis glycosyl transferase WcaI|nr:glycosyltransferase family 4 protein [Opitutaceae bacterium]
MALIFINRFYWPDEPATAQLLTDLAEGLAATGEAVTVITSHNGRADLPGDELRRGVHILRVRSTRWGGKNLAGRALDFMAFSLGALIRLARIARPGDTVVVMTDPPLLAIFATPLARWRGAHIVHWVQDIYPELATALTGAKWLRILRPLRDRAWRRAATCVVPGDDMAACLAGRGVEKITIIPNWAPAGLAPVPPGAADALRDAWGLRGKFIAAYSGNLGRVHDLMPLLDTAAALQAETDIVLVFIGDGAQRDALESTAQKRGLHNVRFFPAQPRTQLAETLALGDVHFVTLRPGCEPLVFPSKLHGIAAVGRPMLFVGPRDCALARLVTGRGMGAVFAREETALLAETIRSLPGDPARQRAWGEAAGRFHREIGGVERAVADWRKVLHTSSSAIESRLPLPGSNSAT